MSGTIFSCQTSSFNSAVLWCTGSVRYLQVSKVTMIDQLALGHANEDLHQMMYSWSAIKFTECRCQRC